jgi:hypothetical protein
MVYFPWQAQTGVYLEYERLIVTNTKAKQILEELNHRMRIQNKYSTTNSIHLTNEHLKPS